MVAPSTDPMPVSKPILKTILLVDADLASIGLLREALSAESYLVFAATSTRGAMRLIKREPINVVVSDIEIAGGSGLDFMIGLRRAHPDVLRIMMSAKPSVDATLRAINEAGVRHFLTKPCEPLRLRSILPDLLAAPAGMDSVASRHEIHDLTPRLLETLELAMTGASEKQIADLLGISPHTAHQYVQALFRRFGVTSRAQLMAQVLRR